MGETGTYTFPQDLVFERREDAEQAGHRTTGWSRQIQSFRQGYEADAEVTQFLQRGHQIRQ